MADEQQPSCLAVDSNAMAISATKFTDLPKEIVAEIMSRLPPESLMECKCLNKFWYFVIKCLIKDPKFVAKHLHHAKSSPVTLLVYDRRSYRERRERKPEPSWSYSYELMTSLLTTSPSDNGDRDDIRLVSEDLSFPVYFSQQGYENVHLCDGIICLSGGSTSITLCNLAMRDFCMFNPGTDLDINEYRLHGTGFGKDLTNGNYKIVRLLDPKKAEVFSPGITDSWREIGISIHNEQYGSLKNCVYIKGKCFWLMIGVPWTLLCFDVSSEVFHVIPLPNGQDLCCSLTERDNFLRFFWYPLVTQDTTCIHMWELDFNDNGGVTEGFTYSWRKCLKTDPFERLYVPLTFWNGDELLIEDADYNCQTEEASENDDKVVMDTEIDRILSYNIGTQKLSKVKLPDYGMLGSVYYSGPYVKSLVSIKEKKLR